jgi:hypothetical protein
MEKVGGASTLVNPYLSKNKDQSLKKDLLDKNKSTDASNLRRSSGSSSSSSSLSGPDLDTPDLPKSSNSDYSLELSDRSKELSKELAKEVAKKEAVDKLTDDDKENKKSKVDKDKKESQSLPTPTKETKTVEEKKETRELAQPAIFFISGAEIFSGASGGRYGGIRKMAEAVKGARHYAWDQKEEMMKEIEKRMTNQPVVLVGHSYGGDTAFEIAEELNSLDHKFRDVDLLVMIDSVGFDNDIIPQNVKKVLNFISDEGSLLGDSPKIAKDSKKSNVENHLRAETHTELDDTVEIQAQILDSIKDLNINI